jgi:nucleotide-binding universal stress UspA family protein
MPRINHVLYATDLSENSVFAFRYAIHCAMKHNARISVLHVLEPLPATAGALAEAMLSREQLQTLRNDKRAHTLDQIHGRIERICEKELPDDPECRARIASIFVSEGFAADEILQKAAELNCDLIIMGTHGKGFMANTFLGSTAKRVLRRSRRPVFVIPLPRGGTDVTFHDDD